MSDPRLTVKVLRTTVTTITGIFKLNWMLLGMKLRCVPARLWGKRI